MMIKTAQKNRCVKNKSCLNWCDVNRLVRGSACESDTFKIVLLYIIGELTVGLAHFLNKVGPIQIGGY